MNEEVIDAEPSDAYAQFSPEVMFQYVPGRLLTDAEREALTTQEDHGVQPAPLRQFADVEEFKGGENNFHNTFTSAPRTFAYEVYRGKLAFQRFRILHADLAEVLDRQLRGRDHVNFTPDNWEMLLEGYRRIAALVDINDPGVMEDGQVKQGLC